MATGYHSTTLQIDNGESLSDESLKLNLRSDRDYSKIGSLVGIAMPAAWTAASLTFQASNDDATWKNVYASDGTEFAVQAAADRWIAVDPADFAGIAYLKVRSGTSGTPVNQVGDRVLTFVVRAV